MNLLGFSQILALLILAARILTACQRSKIMRDYDCLCEDGFSPAEIGSKLGGCFQNSNQTGQLLLHAEEKKYLKCMDGNLLCLMEGKTVNHGESFKMMEENPQERYISV